MAGLGKAIVNDRFRGQRRMGVDERGLVRQPSEGVVVKVIDST